MTWLKNFFLNIFTGPGFKVDEALRRKLLIAAGVLLIAIVGTMAFKLGRWSTVVVSADSSAWETALQARLILFRIKVAVGLAFGSLAFAYGTFQLLDRSRLGQRLFHWAEHADTEYSSASKTLGAALFFGLLVLGLLMLAARVLA